MTYSEIVEKLKEKEEFYSHKVFYTKEYAAVKFYEEYNSITEKNMDIISINDLIAMMLIKADLYIDATGQIMHVLNGFTKKIIETMVSDCLSGDHEQSLLNIKEFLQDIDQEKTVLSYTPDFYNIVRELIDDIRTTLSDPKKQEIMKRLIGYKYMNNKMCEGVNASQRRKLKKIFHGYEVQSALKKLTFPSDEDFAEAYMNLYPNIRKYIDYAYQVSGGLSTKKINNMASKYKNALAKFEEADEMDDMTMCLDAVSMIDDSELLKEIYFYINRHNKPYFIEIEEEYNEKSKNTSYNYIEFFKGYGLDFSILDNNFKNKIMEDGIDITKTKLSIISKIADKKDYFTLIAASSIDSLLYIDDLAKKGFIDYEFIKSNISIIVNSLSFDKFKTNLELLIDRVNIKRYNDKSFLLGDNNIIRDNIILLEKYNIPYKNCYNLSFIDKDIKNKISLFIEVGLETQIYNNPDILNVDEDLAKRVLLTTMVGEEYLEDDKLTDMVINPDKFFAPASKVSYLLQRDNTKYNGNGVLYLSKLDSTKLSYMMDGVIIPKTRVSEQPIKLEDIIKPSLYSEEEIKILEKNATK